ncbi:conserved hypothetical protein [Agrobacterium fabacearum CFBP 5771]|nr:conserved hypothetical protein [Agrobacterium fabacearum CFBP 5771]
MDTGGVSGRSGGCGAGAGCITTGGWPTAGWVDCWAGCGWRGTAGGSVGDGTGAGAVCAGFSGDMSKGEDCAIAPVATTPNISVSELLIVLPPFILQLRQV